MLPEDKLCSICQLNEHKYTCPACGAKTCSINCVRRHKRQTECTGLVDQARFIPKKELALDETNVNRDYNFLMTVGRQINVGKGDIKTTAKNIFKRQNVGGNPNRNKRFKPTVDEEDPRMECVNKVFSQNPNTMIKRNNTMVIQLPAGMSRAASNKTGYDKKAGTFIWTVEWVLLGEEGDEKARFLSFRLKEHLLLRDAVPMNILHNAVSQSDKEEHKNPIDKEQLHFYLDNVVKTAGTKNSILELDGTKLISDALANKIILEYPTIYITFNRSTWKDFIISENLAYNYHNDESSDSSLSSDEGSDSSSDSSDDSSDDPDGNSDSDNDSGSDSGPPPESSSKILKVSFDDNGDSCVKEAVGEDPANA